MRFKQAFIYGFGKWVDYTIDFSDSSFLVIYGTNESGKSTIQNYILFMLFGLYPSERAFYRPKTSSKMGGRLTVIDPDVGEFTIERLDHVRNGKAVCFTETEQYDEEWLKKRLNGLTRETYQAIFSFSAVDLLTIRDMKEDELSEVLLNIGLTGSTHIHTVEKKLDDSLADLFKPYGTRPKMNQQLSNLKIMVTKQKQLKDESIRYRDKREAVSRWQAKLARLEERLTEEREAFLQLERVEQALPYLYSYIDAFNEKNTLDEIIGFPEDGILRLEQIKENMVPLLSEYAIYEKNMQEYHKKMTDLEDVKLDQASLEQIDKALQYEARYQHLNEELRKLKKAYASELVQLNTELEHLNLKLTRDGLPELRLPFHIEKTWLTIKQRHEDLTLQSEQLNREKRMLEKRLTQLEEEKKSIEGQLLSQETRLKMEQTMEHSKKAVYMKMLEQRYNRTNEKAKTSIDKLQQKTKLTSIIGMIISLISGIFALLNESPWYYAGILIGLLLSGASLFVGKKSKVYVKQWMTTMNEVPDSILSQEEEKEVLAQLASDNTKRQQLSSIQQEIKKLSVQYHVCDEKIIDHTIHEQQLDHDIHEQQKRYPFLSDVEVSFWPTLFHTLKRILARHKNVADIKTDMIECEQHINHIREVVIVLMKDLRIRQMDKAKLSSCFEQLKEMINDDEKKQIKLENYKRLSQDVMNQLASVQANIKIYEQEKQLLFQTAHAQDEEDYYRRAKQYERHQYLVLKIEQIENSYAPMFSKKEWDALVKEQPTHKEISMKKQEQALKMNHIEEDIEHIRKQIATAEVEMKELISSHAYSEWIHRFQLEKDELNTLAKQWSTLKVARMLLQETKKKYKENYLQHILDKASTFFMYITNEQYAKIIAPTDDSGFKVESKNQLRYDVTELSQGTIDQLYVSLRLAIGVIMSKSERLPFIIDDAFVHFDGKRTDRILDILATLAKERQVILFTCKKDIKERVDQTHIMTIENAYQHI
ncbi:MAG TPA: AAA family ATPase [Cerasibacillus sp.]|uniref:ATP-binding protein n=1 Tax=Cerasibacillus sp. TaxID=2498711 RepID=UPI002F42E249